MIKTAFKSFYKNRRITMKKIVLLLAFIFTSMSVNANEAKNLSADEALAKLQVGNANFVKMHLAHPNATKERRDSLVKGQHPFAIVVTCSDSRVPAEMIFDQGLGDIFVIRNAGNVLDDHVIGSIDYAVHHLGVNLVVIMGHQSCGAVGAAMATNQESKYIETIKKTIQPAIEKCKKDNCLTYENAIKTNAKLGAETLLKNDEEMEEAVKEHGVKVVPAYYNLETGKVEFMCK